MGTAVRHPWRGALARRTPRWRRRRAAPAGGRGRRRPGPAQRRATRPPLGSHRLPDQVPERYLDRPARACLIESGSLRVAVIIEPAHPARLYPLLESAYQLTPRERDVTRLVLQGA